MKKLLTATLLALSFTSVMADNLTWVEVSHSEDGATRFSVARETTRIAKNNANDQIVLTTAKTLIDEKVNTFQWAIRITDCQRKFGNVDFLNLSGTWLAAGEFAFGNETMLTAAAQRLCDWALNTALKPASKPVPAKPNKAAV